MPQLHIHLYMKQDMATPVSASTMYSVWPPVQFTGPMLKWVSRYLFSAATDCEFSYSNTIVASVYMSDDRSLFEFWSSRPFARVVCALGVGPPGGCRLRL